MEEAKKLFGKHPFHHTIIGREKDIVRMVARELPYLVERSKEWIELWKKYDWKRINSIQWKTEKKGLHIFGEIYIQGNGDSTL